MQPRGKFFQQPNISAKSGPSERATWTARSAAQCPTPTFPDRQQYKSECRTEWLVLWWAPKEPPSSEFNSKQIHISLLQVVTKSRSSKWRVFLTMWRRPGRRSNRTSPSARVASSTPLATDRPTRTVQTFRTHPFWTASRTHSQQTQHQTDSTHSTRHHRIRSAPSHRATLRTTHWWPVRLQISLILSTVPKWTKSTAYSLLTDSPNRFPAALTTQTRESVNLQLSIRSEATPATRLFQALCGRTSPASNAPSTLTSRH